MRRPEISVRFSLRFTGLALVALVGFTFPVMSGAPQTSPRPEPRAAAPMMVAALPAAVRPVPRPVSQPAEPQHEQDVAGVVDGAMDGAVDGAVEGAVTASEAVTVEEAPTTSHPGGAGAADAPALADASAVPDAVPAVRVAAPAEQAMRPLPRSRFAETLTLAAAAGQTVVAPRPGLAAASSAAVARSLRPLRRSETGRLQYLRRVAAAAVVRTQPAPEGSTGAESTALCGVPGLVGRTMPPIVSNVQGCGVGAPVRVTEVDGVALSQATILDCSAAQALHNWVRQGLRPAVGALGGGPAALRVAAHYTCRTRNNQAGARVSEHGRGRAIDISALTLRSGEVMTVLADWTDPDYGAVLQQMHRAACGPFTTTLGPGSDGFHEDHMHFDVARHRSGTYCR